MFAKDKDKIFASLQDNINIIYSSEFLSNHQAKKYFNIFEDKLIYNSDEDSKVLIRGKMIKIPRKQVAYGDQNTFYNFAARQNLEI